MEYLTAATLLILLLWGWQVLTTGSAPFVFNGTTKRFGVLALAGLISLLVSPNKVEGLLAPFGAGTFLCFFSLALIAPTLLSEKTRVTLRWTIMIAVSVVGLLVLYQFMGLAKLIEINAELMTVFIVTIPVIFREAVHRKKSGPDTHMIAAIVMGVACFGGLVLTGYQTLPSWQTSTLPFWANWQMILESYKNWQNLLVGVGAQNFLSAFTLGRPAAINMMPIWDTRFLGGSSLLFHIATVYGLIGVAALGWFLTSLHPVAIFSFLFLPPSFPALIVVGAFLIISKQHTHTIVAKNALARLAAVVVMVLLGIAGYGLYRAIYAQRLFAQSLAAIQKRDGSGAYTLQISAIAKNPYITRYHTAYSQTNLAIAQTISNSASDSATATQLVQQAIREAKIAVNLAPENILAWENLALVYQTLTGVAQGAGQWATASYQKAVSLDPTNPVLRVRLGGTYAGEQKFDEAVQSYTAAITLKPDYANAYYNLAFVYRQQKKYAMAITALQETMKYMTPNIDERNRVQQELDALRDLVPSSPLP